ncbi:hypothetical protein IPJ91_01745 [bacterium]|nr:MAG: hypothetical protein IPJ91_01745 [bacterium]
MKNLIIFQNPEEIIQQNFFINFNLGEEFIKKIKFPNRRIDLSEENDFIFIVMYIAEYDLKLKVVNQIELNIFFHKETQHLYLFAYNTKYFFEKYKVEFEHLNFHDFGEFIEFFFDIVLKDEVKIIEHILEDTYQIKSEFFAKANSATLIRHLTNNEINISTLKLISATQNKLLDLLKPYLQYTHQTQIDYERNNILDELNFANEFCHTLMSSINTKYNVKEADAIHKLNSIMLVIFVTDLVTTLLLYLFDGGKHTYLFGIGIMSIITTYIVVTRNKNTK